MVKGEDIKSLTGNERAEIVLIEPQPYEIKVKIGDQAYSLTDEMLEECTDWSFMGGYSFSPEVAMKLAATITGLPTDDVVAKVGSLAKLEILMKKSINVLIGKIRKDVNAPLFDLN